MVITWDMKKKKAAFNNVHFDIASVVRNELNGRRRLHDKKEVVRVVNKERTWGSAYMPRPFPAGKWEVTGIHETIDRNFAPVKILTDAHQKVEVWALDKSGGYEKGTGEFVDDWGYYLHFAAASRTTLGCGRVGNDSDKQVRLLAKMIQEAWGNGELVYLDVIGGNDGQAE